MSDEHEYFTVIAVMRASAPYRKIGLRRLLRLHERCKHRSPAIAKRCAEVLAMAGWEPGGEAA